MGNYFFDQPFIDGPDRVDGKAKVTGMAKFSAEYELPGLTYGVFGLMVNQLHWLLRIVLNGPFMLPR